VSRMGANTCTKVFHSFGVMSSSSSLGFSPGPTMAHMAIGLNKLGGTCPLSTSPHCMDHLMRKAL